MGAVSWIPLLCEGGVPTERISHTPQACRMTDLSAGFMADLSAVILVDLYTSIVANDTLMVD